MLKGLFKSTGKVQRVPAPETPLRRMLRLRLTATLQEIATRYPAMRPVVLALGGKALQFLASLSDDAVRELVVSLHEETTILYDIAVNDGA